MKKYNVAILGATGAVGAEFLKLIEERNFPFNELRLLASKRSAIPLKASISRCSRAAASPRNLHRMP